MYPQLPLRAIALSVMFASGCQAPMQLHQLKQPLFAMGQADQPVSTWVVGHPTAASGQLTVRFDGALAQLSQGRRIQATVADVDSVVVTVKPQGATEVSQTVPKAALNNGQTSVTFQGLPPGAATVTITAFDAAGVNIGSVTQAATVTAGQVASVNVTLQLNPTIVGSGSGGGGTPTTGGLAANVSLSDGAVVAAPAIGATLGTFALDGYPWSVAVDGAGQAWVSGGDGNLGGKLWLVAPNGTILRNIAFNGGVKEIALDGQGQVWALELNNNTSAAPYYTLYRHDADGARLSSLQMESHLDATSIKADANGRVWVYSRSANRLLKMAADGTIESDIVLDGTAGAINNDFAIGGNGEVWVTYAEADQVCRFSSTGSRLGTTPVPAGLKPGTIAVDAGGNAWVQSTAFVEPKLWKFSPTGALMETHDIGYNPGMTLMVHQGAVWCGGYPMYHVPAGSATAVEMLHMDHQPYAMAAGSSGLWMVELDEQRVRRLAL